MLNLWYCFILFMKTFKNSSHFWGCRPRAPCWKTTRATHTLTKILSTPLFTVDTLMNWAIAWTVARLLEKWWNFKFIYIFTTKLYTTSEGNSSFRWHDGNSFVDAARKFNFTMRINLKCKRKQFIGLHITVSFNECDLNLCSTFWNFRCTWGCLLRRDSRSLLEWIHGLYIRQPF